MSSPHIEYLYSLDRLGIKPGLERMEAIMEALGHPERKFKSIHISGTNGKGSVAAMIESVLRTSGQKTGLYTSPDIYSFHERIQVNGVPISDADLAKLIRVIREVAEKNNIELTFFEFGTALCYLHFARQNLDIAVIEVGMGGLLDATNVISPLLSAITNIGLDHQEFLGDTKEKIAIEKAGIVKQNVPCVTGEKDPAVLKVIEESCAKHSAPLIKAYEGITIEVLGSSWEGQHVQVSGLWNGEVQLPLLGNHQIENLKVALTAMRVLFDRESRVTTEWNTIKNGIEQTKWDGRLDIISKQPLIIADGAHNADGMNALADFVEKLPRREALIFGLKEGKKVDEAVLRLASLFSHVIVAEGNYQPQNAQVIGRYLRKAHRHVTIERNIKQALGLAHGMAGRSGTIVVAGSLYLVADALVALRPKALVRV